MRDAAELPTGGDADIAALASLLADPARCKVLLALDDGRALPASVLADEAGVSRPTASSHLGKLTDAGLLSVETHGRHRYYRLAGPEVGELLEQLGRLAPTRPVVAAGGHPCGAAALGAHLLRPCRGPPRRGCHGQPAGSRGARRRRRSLRPAPRQPRRPEQPRPRPPVRADRRRAGLPHRHRCRNANGQKTTRALLRGLDRAAAPPVRRARTRRVRSLPVGGLG